MDVKILKTNLNGNSNIGLYSYCLSVNGKNLCLLGEDFGSSIEKEISKILSAEIVHVKIAGTPLLGVFLSGNNNNLLVPRIAFDNEIKQLKDLGINVRVFDTKLTCLGNNIACNDFGALVNIDFTDGELKFIKEALKVPVKRISIAETEGPGACIVTNGKKGIIHRDAEDFEIEMVQSNLGLDSLEPCSINMGSPYLKSGLIVNNNGFIVGEQSGGPEIIYVEQSLFE